MNSAAPSVLRVKDLTRRKEGPDNLWALDDTQYLLWECKSEVDITRSHINKREAEQMNRSSAWFDKHYAGMKDKRVIIHPSHTVESAAAFTHEVEAVREAELKAFVKAGRDFFKSFESQNFKDLSTIHIQKMVDAPQAVGVGPARQLFEKAAQHQIGHALSVPTHSSTVGAGPLSVAFDQRAEFVSRCSRNA